MSRFTDEQRERIIAAWQDDPDGWKHPIWTELGLDPQPPVSAEERWLTDRATEMADWDGEVVVGPKVWDRDSNGNWYKLWTLDDPQLPKPVLRRWRRS